MTNNDLNHMSEALQQTQGWSWAGLANAARAACAARFLYTPMQMGSELCRPFGASGQQP